MIKTKPCPRYISVQPRVSTAQPIIQRAALVGYIAKLLKLLIAFAVATAVIYGLMLLGLRGAEIEENMRVERTVQYIHGVNAANPDGIVVPSNEH